MTKYRENGPTMIRIASLFLIILICNRFVQIFYLQTHLDLKSKKGGISPQARPQASLTREMIDLECNHSLNSSLDTRKALPNKIPLLIHQAYPHQNIPEPLSKFADTWKDHHFGWKFLLWNEQDLDDLVRFEFPWAHEMYSSLKYFEEKLHVAKFFILLTVSSLSFLKSLVAWRCLC